jgi:1,4-alpha-glucan branching enzyme
MAKMILGKREVTFTIAAPEAKAVSLAGDFTNWAQSPIPLRKRRGGVWAATIPLGPGTYQYRLLVDGEWQDDPQCPNRVPNSFGTQNCVRQVA